jgi:hypothetical protein
MQRIPSQWLRTESEPMYRSGSLTRFPRHWATLCGLLAVLCWATSMGCDKGPERLPVSGVVRFDGEPLATGSLLMTPLKLGPVAGCDIKDGRFEMPRDRGPGPGEYRVEITAYRPTGQKVYDSDLNATTETLKPIIPTRYNTQSELTVTISHETENHFTFNLKSK